MQASSGNQYCESDRTWFGGNCNPALPFTPEDPYDDDRYDEAVPHVFVIPPLSGHAAERRRVANQEEDRSEKSRPARLACGRLHHQESELRRLCVQTEEPHNAVQQ